MKTYSTEAHVLVDTYVGDDPLREVSERGFYSFNHIVNGNMKVTAQHGENKTLFVREIMSGSLDGKGITLGEQHILDADDINKIEFYQVINDSEELVCQ